MKRVLWPELEVQEDPRQLSAAQLAQLGVSRLNRFNALLQCMQCGTIWSPTLKPDGMLPPGYWRCPNRCNW